MDTAGSPELPVYPLVARGDTRDSTLVEVSGRRTLEVRLQPEDARRDGPGRIRVGELARFADKERTLVAPMGKTIG